MSVPKFSRSSAAVLASAIALAAAGCATVADPVPLAERSLAKPQPMHEVLVVLDYRLEAQLNPGRSSEGLYLPIAEMASGAVKAAGGNPTVVFVKTETDMPKVDPKYSHVWVQRITSLTGVTSKYGTHAERRRWRATIAHRTAPGGALTPAYQSEYVSDAMNCFSVSLYANKDECKVKIRALLEHQVQQYQAGA